LEPQQDQRGARRHRATLWRDLPAKPFPDTDHPGWRFCAKRDQAGRVQHHPWPALRSLQAFAPRATAAACQLGPGRHAAPGPGVAAGAAFAPYGQWAKGFRAPTPDQVNNGFSNLASGYTTVGNAQLKPEHADSLSWACAGAGSGALFGGGLRQPLPRLHQPAGCEWRRHASNPTVFQYINLANARIHGLEARSEWRWPKLDGHRRPGLCQGSQRGQRRENPAGHGAAASSWSWACATSRPPGGPRPPDHSAGKARSDISTGAAQFAPPAYNVLDLGWHWKPTPR
jgi:hemoglobin/transferrin/lactoferrin receptor protein